MHYNNAESALGKYKKMNKILKPNISIIKGSEHINSSFNEAVHDS